MISQRGTQSRRSFLGSSLVAGLTTACKTLRPTFGTQAQREAVAGLRQTPCPNNELGVLSWNIFMMPQWLCESPRNLQRAAAQATVLMRLGYDILCFQKAFDSAARQILKGALGGTYPYDFGPANDSFSLKETSGVWVLSKRPLVNYAEIQFDKCGGVECLSRKGAMLLTGACGSQLFVLITSHLQGEEVEGFTAKNTKVRAEQMEQIRDELLLPNIQPGIPVFICGDFSTPHFDATDAVESGPYKHMIRTFGADDGPFRSITVDNDLESATPPAPNDELEYILTRANGCAFEVERTRYTLRRTGWDPRSNRNDLAYRRAVGARIRFKSSAAPG